MMMRIPRGRQAGGNSRNDSDDFLTNRTSTIAGGRRLVAVDDRLAALAVMYARCV